MPAPAIAAVRTSPRASTPKTTTDTTTHSANEPQALAAPVAAHLTWPELQSAVASCQACGLCASRQNTVFGVGQASSDALQAPQVDWLIVGEAPGENEDSQGEPFVGQAGKLLDNMLAAIKVSEDLSTGTLGLSRRQGTYITNVLKCRPPANRNPSPEEVAMCEPYLARQIELLRPKVILAMGKFAIQSLTGSTEAVGKLRGRVHTLRHPHYQAPVIVTYHPAYLLRNLPEKAKAWRDLLLAMETFAGLNDLRNGPR
jgi:uracil-DNA glycosylase